MCAYTGEHKLPAYNKPLQRAHYTRTTTYNKPLQRAHYTRMTT